MIFCEIGLGLGASDFTFNLPVDLKTSVTPWGMTWTGLSIVNYHFQVKGFSQVKYGFCFACLRQGSYSFLKFHDLNKLLENLMYCRNLLVSVKKIDNLYSPLKYLSQIANYLSRIFFMNISYFTSIQQIESIMIKRHNLSHVPVSPYCL